MSRRPQDFQTIRSEGGLLPPDLLRRVIDPKAKLEGTLPEDYGLPKGERLNEVITQSWNRLRKHWSEFRAAAALLPEGEAATGLTNDKWNLPLFRELGFGLLQTTAGPEIGGRTYAINRFFGSVPVHLIGCGLSLDRRTAGARGAAAVNPHGLVQEFLNRSTGHLWAILSNGLRLRFLRDNQALSRQSYLEFDLEAMFSGEVYSDFVLLWLTTHATRFAPRDGNRPETCWLERWTKVAEEEGTRALAALSGGVERALQVLGQGLVGHPKNTALREALRSGTFTLRDFHGQLLRVVYRFIFLFVSEDRILEGRPLIHPIDDSETARLARERYAAHYSTARLRELASRIKGSRHGDLWQQFQLIVGALSGDERFAPMREALALPILGSLLWNPASTAHLNGPGLATPGAELTNFDFLEALRHLAFTRQGKVLRPVDYKNLGSEEFGGVYEGLLELTPQISSDGARFFFVELAGNERKTSGSYYTPDSLVQCLLDSALDPVVEDRTRGKSAAEAAEAILSLKVCDPAVGSGHFLVGAAHRLARHLSRVRALAQGESEPSPLLYQTALREIIGHCLYGVDLNPMAVELCKVTLWLEATEPGKPLSFLDHHIRTGNSLIGTTPRVLADGLPDDAFKPIEGDDKEVCANAKKQNKLERKIEGHGELFDREERAWSVNELPAAMLALGTMSDDTAAALHAKEQRYAELVRSTGYLGSRFLADAWCAAFVWKKTRDLPYPITNDVLRKIERNPHDCAPWMRAEIELLRDRYQFFHWHLAFPEVFPVPGKGERPENEHTGWNGGFDVMLGNPPWERVKLQEKEWFAERRPEIAAAANAAARKRLIEKLAIEAPALHSAFSEAARQAEGESHVLRNSALYPLCGRGDINLYAVFAERMRLCISPRGRVGAVLPSGLATDDTTKFFFADLMQRGSLVSFFEFENEGFFTGAGQGHMVRFALATMTGSAPSDSSADFVFQAKAITDLADPQRHFTLSAADIELINPNTRTCPIFRTRRDASLTKGIYSRVPLLWLESDSKGGPWHVRFLRMFDMANDSDLFFETSRLLSEGDQLVGITIQNGEQTFLPLFEAKMIQLYNHRHGDFADAGGERAHVLPTVPPQRWTNPAYFPNPYYWVPEVEVDERLRELPNRGWMLGWRDVTDARASARTVIASVIPRAGVNDKFLLLFSSERDLALLYANLATFPFDYAARQKVAGLALKYFTMRQLPVLPPGTYAEPSAWAGGAGETLRDWLLPRVLELTYTAWDLEPFARDCGWFGPPFVWDEARRFQLRCELDAAFFHLYGLSREDAAYILETFPIVRRKDEAAHGTYITKDTILFLYDQLADAQRTGQPFTSPLNPPPGDRRACHPKRKIAILAFGSLRGDPGKIGDHIAFRIKTETPFKVEYGRLSSSRGGAPTLVPDGKGSKVEAELLILPDGMPVTQARDLLWLRERRKEDSGEAYSIGTGPNHVLVREWTECPWVETVLYTDFNASGKQTLTAEALAKAAIDSVRKADKGKDGITYLQEAEAAGIKTPLTEAYHKAILRLTGTDSLLAARKQAEQNASA